MANEQLRRALEEQEKVLQELEAKLVGLRELQQRRDAVHSLVNQMRFALDLGPYIGNSPAEPEKDNAPDRPIWAVAEEVLRKAGKPLTVGKITEML